MSRKAHFKKDAVIYDLDGTLRDDEGGKNAPEIKKNVKHLRKDEKKGKKVVILTSKSSKDREKTEDWLDEHDIEPDKLVMRPKGNKKSDPKVKEELLKDEVLPEYAPKKAYDDKKTNIKMLKKHGIKTKKV